MTSLLDQDGTHFEKVHVIEHVDSNAGFCAVITYALNGVRKALENGWLPVVRFEGQTARYFYDPEFGENVWDYYFEPVMGVRWDEVREALEDGRLSPSQLHHYEESEFLSWHHSDPDRLATFWATEVPANPAAWIAEKRDLGREFVSRFVRVKAPILEKVEAFRREHLSGDMNFGVHIRGTDFAYAAPTRPQRYIDEIRQIAAERGLDDYRVFVATDQEQYVESFREEFGDRVVTYDAVRSTGELPPFKMKEISPYRLGEDVLIDVLLLASCQHILKGAAAVGEYALWFNPEATVSDFALESDFDPRSLPYLTSAYLKLNLGGYGPVRLALARAWAFVAPLLTAPFRFVARVVRFAWRQFN